MPGSGTGDGAFETYKPLGLLKFKSLTGLNRFNPKVYGLQPPCLRLTHAVTDMSPRLGMECAGSALFQWHLQPPAVRHFVAHYRRNKRGMFSMIKDFEFDFMLVLESFGCGYGVLMCCPGPAPAQNRRIGPTPGSRGAEKGYYTVGGPSFERRSPWRPRWSRWSRCGRAG